MVKNIVGGNRSRGFARKSYNKSSSSVVRTPNNILEQFAIVTKLFGQGRCQVITSEPNPFTLNCIIRNKFKARFKNMNLVSLHSIILVGFRDWEAPDFKICDLLEVYSNDDISHLRTIPAFTLNIASFDKHTNTHTTDYTPLHDFEFSNTPQNILHTNTPIHATDTNSYTQHDDFDFHDI